MQQYLYPCIVTSQAANHYTLTQGQVNISQSNQFKLLLIFN